MHHLVRRLVTAILLAGSAAAVVAGPAAGIDRSVTMSGNAYLPPGPTRIAPGDTVTWVNEDAVPHDAVGSGWSTPLLMQGDSASVTFNTAGTYSYTCTIHPSMQGQIVVRVAASGGGAVPNPPTDTEAPGTAALDDGDRPSPGALVLAAAGLAFALAIRRTARRPG